MNKIFRFVLTALLLILVVSLAGLFDQEKRSELWDMIQHPDWLWLFICVLVGFLLNLSSAIKWWMLSRSGGLEVSLLRSWAYYMVGMFYNLILPTSVGGDVIRAYELGKFTKDPAKATASVFVERYTGILMLLLFSLIAVFLNAKDFHIPVITFSLGAFSIVLAIIGWLAFDQRSLKLTQKMFGGIHSFIDKVLIKIGKLQRAVLTYKDNKKALLWAVFNSFVFYVLAILNVFTTAKVFDIGVSLEAVILATPVIMLLMNIFFVGMLPPY